MKEYAINGKKVWLLTLYEVSRLVGISSRVLRSYEADGILPRAHFTVSYSTPISPNSQKRLYAEDQAEVLFTWVQKYRLSPVRKGNRSFTQAMIDELHKNWEEATKKILGIITPAKRK